MKKLFSWANSLYKSILTYIPVVKPTLEGFITKVKKDCDTITISKQYSLPTYPKNDGYSTESYPFGLMFSGHIHCESTDKTGRTICYSEFVFVKKADEYSEDREKCEELFAEKLKYLLTVFMSQLPGKEIVIKSAENYATGNHLPIAS